MTILESSHWIFFVRICKQRLRKVGKATHLRRIRENIEIQSNRVAFPHDHIVADNIDR